MTRQLKYERPKLIDLTSKEWNVGFGDDSPSPGCTNGDKPTPPSCTIGTGVGG